MAADLDDYTTIQLYTFLVTLNDTICYGYCVT